jgi:hypothetical protein
MDMRARKQYLQMLLGRYLKARKRQKGSLLTEYCRNTGQNRKYVIRRLSALASGQTKAVKKRAAFYGRDVRQALETLWAIFDYPRGQRLRPLLRTELERLRRLGEIEVTTRTAAKLERISPATIDRLLRSSKRDFKAGRRYRHGSAGLIANKIPLRLGEWRNVQVGQVDLDLVLHCGSSVAGEYGHSLSTVPSQNRRELVRLSRNFLIPVCSMVLSCCRETGKLYTLTPRGLPILIVVIGGGTGSRTDHDIGRDDTDQCLSKKLEYDISLRCAEHLANSDFFCSLPC